MTRRWVPISALIAAVSALLVGISSPTWAAHERVTLDITPEENEVMLDFFASFTLTASLSEPAPPEAGLFVDFEHVGAQDPDRSDTPLSPDYSCRVTASTSSCSVSVPHVNLDEGKAVVYAWLDADATAESDGNAVCEADRRSVGCRPVAPLGGGSGDEGVDEQVAAGSVVEPDQTDVAGASYRLPRHPGLNCVADEPRVALGEPSRVECEILDGTGRLVSPGAVIDGEFRSGPSAPESHVAPPPDISDCANPCRFGFTAPATGTDVLCFWVDSDHDDAVRDGAAEEDGGGCAAEAAQTGDDADSTDVVRLTVVDDGRPPPPPPRSTCAARGATVDGTVVTGTPGDDTIVVTGDCTRVEALEGKNRITVDAHQGTTTINGGPDKDRICAANGSTDAIAGGGGKDRAVSDQADTLDGRVTERPELDCGPPGSSNSDDRRPKSP